jgi:YD repeat-containing protein
MRTRCATVLLTLSFLAASRFDFAQSQPGAGMTRTAETGGQISDREQARLRGPVKSVVEQRTMSGINGQPELKSSTTTEYTPDGRILSVLDANSNGYQWLRTSTYSPEGRLNATSWGRPGEPPAGKEVYSYDDKGRLISVANTHPGASVEFRYDEQGRKTKIQKLEPVSPGTASSFYWEGAELSFTVPSGGTVETFYDKDDDPTEAHILDDSGRQVAHIIRSYDSNGRVKDDEQIVDQPSLILPKEFSAHLNPEQAKAVGAWLAIQLASNGVSYSYDKQGRLTEKRVKIGSSMEMVTNISYNEHGDKAEERITNTQNPESGTEYSLEENGNMAPVQTPAPSPPTYSEMHYSYVYDSFGNWTEQDVTSRSGPGEPLKASARTVRTLTYY